MNNKPHYHENFPLEVVKHPETIISPELTEYEFVKPTIGKLYRVKANGSDQKRTLESTNDPDRGVQFQTFEEQSWIEDDGELVEFLGRSRVDVPVGDVVLVLDYIIREHNKDIERPEWKKASYSLIVKALWGEKYVYRAFLVTVKYNEFDCRFELVGEN